VELRRRLRKRCRALYGPLPGDGNRGVARAGCPRREDLRRQPVLAHQARVPARKNKTQVADSVRQPGHFPGARPARLLALLAAVLSSACGGSEPGAGVNNLEMRPPQSGPQTPPSGAMRAELDLAELLRVDAYATGPIDNRFYMPVGAPLPAAHGLQGRLSVAEAPMHGTTTDSNYGQTGLLWFPGFAADFFVVGDYLVPVERGILARAGTRSHWRVILSPGRTWAESGDGGWSRASFPFVLVSDDTNEAHNGLATFLFNDTQTSALQFQIVQETASWNRNDFWGRLPLAYTPGARADEPALRAQFEAEIASLTPVRDWSALGSHHDASLWHEFTRGLDSDDLSASGVVVDGVIYMRPCATRLGDYPYCEFMRHGAFSVTKSMGAALTLLRLAQKYGDEVLTLKIRDYVDVTARHSGWSEVRFIDVLDMATGVGDANPDRHAIDPFADENAVTLGAWSSSDSEDLKLDAVFAQGDYSWGPGEVFRYNTTHTFVLSAAMQEFLVRREGADARLWDMMMREVFEPIGIRHFPMMHTLEAGAAPGIPLMGIGLYPTVDDVAKIATLLHDGGRVGGVQLLSERGLRDALFDGGHGLPTGEVSAAGQHFYSMSFWSLPQRQGRCFEQMPYMEGYGGNLVLLHPSGATAFRFADAGSYDVEALSEVASEIRHWCR